MPRSTHKSFPSSTQHLHDVRRFVEQCAVDAHLPTETVEQLKIAVDEACSNIIKHAYKGGACCPIDIDVEAGKDRFTVKIRDNGCSFDPSEYQAPNIHEAAKSRKSGGFGVHIMRQFMDRVEYRTKGQTNEVCLTKFLSRRSGNGGKKG